MKNLRTLFIPLTSILLLLASSPLLAATYYVDTNAPDNSGDGSSLNPVKYISTGIALMSSSGGDTLVLKDGTYSNSKDTMSSFVSGTTGNYNVIKAANDGGAIVKNPLVIGNNEHHIQIEGIKFATNGNNGIGAAHHIKVLRCAFEGGPLQGNTYTFGMGSNNPGTTTEYILIEDSWFYGPGGRQNLLIYKSNKIVIRRVVLRHDLGWSNAQKSDPEGVGTIYNSNNVEIQNVIVIDSDSNPANVGSEWAGAFTVVNNASSGGTCKDNNLTGMIILNVEGNGFEHGGDGQVLNTQIKDTVLWWNKPGQNMSGGAISTNNPGYKTIFATNVTVGNYWGGITMWGGTNSAINMSNSILYNISSLPINVPSPGDGTITHSYTVCSNNNANNNLCTNSGTNTITTDPTTIGLQYPPRIENGSQLMTAGQGNTRSGAVITNKIGVSGTLWGEAGYNTVTNDALWPWPYEARIHSDMSSVSSRGFAASGQTLTNYIWSALGNTPPSDIASSLIPIAQNVKFTKQ